LKTIDAEFMGCHALTLGALRAVLLAS